MKSKKNSPQARSVATSSDATSAARADFDSMFKRLSSHKRDGYYTVDQWRSILATDSLPTHARVRDWIRGLIADGRAEIGRVRVPDLSGRPSLRPAYKVQLCDS